MPAGHGKLEPLRIVRRKEANKTLVMELIEQRLGLPMEVLLLQGREVDIAKRLGVDISTVSKWRKRLDLR
jgi:transcriptional regulator with XRE-family HTH domain